ncbi:MAG: hypothetical protein QM817_33165 [Archangium sp.]
MRTRIVPLVVCLSLSLAACRPSTTEPTVDSGTPAVVPSAPLTVTAVVDNGTIAVSWTLGADASSASQIVIARAVVPQASSRPAATELQIIAGLATTDARFVDLDVEVGKIYVYAVALRSSGGRSAFTLQPDSVALAIPTSTCARTVTATDSDGDTLSDVAEAAGWTVLIDEDGTGTLSMRTVKSSAFSADTDGDGVCDDEESSLRLDPRKADSDGDGLTDFDEVNRWGSSPTDVDSDNDAQGNPIFYDGSELLTFHTSPTLADTDGDGRSDFEEINQNNTNALVAEIPQPALAVLGRMRVGVDLQFENGTTQSDAVTQNFEQGTSNALTKSSSSSSQHSVEEGFTVSTEASAGYPSGASVEVTGSVSAKETYVKDTSSSVSRNSASDSQETYENMSSAAISNNTTVTGGSLALDFEVRNEGTRTFQLSNVVVTALRRDRNDPTQFTSVATLNFPTTANNLVLAEGQNAGPIRATAAISGNAALDLLSNPDTLFFQTANFSLTDKTGTAFSFAIGEETTSRTALLTLDFGGVRPLERYRVATNVERNATGKTAGARLGDVLRDVLGLQPGVGFETATKGSGSGAKVLIKLRDVASTPTQIDGGTGAGRFWVLFATTNPDTTLAPVSQRITAPTVDFEDIVLMPRDSLTLAYVADVDRDGLFEREELTYGTSDQIADSDQDGLTDFEEVRTGWTVAVDNAFYRAHPKVFSIPTVADADGDGWTDPVERMHGTDPNRRDTDGDGLQDDVDPAPAEGPHGTWVKVLGTSANETALQVFPQGDALFVLGTSTGDIDGDSVSGGPFVMALEATTGATRWVKQLEGSTKFSKKLTFAGGKVRWISDVQPNVLPGVTTAGMNVVSFDPMTGATTTSDFTNAGSNGSYAISKVAASNSLELMANGHSTWFVAPFTQFSGNPGMHLADVDANGGFAGTSTLSMGETNSAYTLMSTSSSGSRWAFTYDYRDSTCAAGGTRIFISAGGGNLMGAAAINTCPSGATPPRLVALDHRGGIVISFVGSSGDTIELRPITGFGTAWSKNFAGVFASSTARVSSIQSDEVNQYYVGLYATSGTAPSAAVQILTPSGGVLDTLLLGNSTTRIAGVSRDPIGNLFLTGSSVGGFTQFGMGLGGDDLVIARNPQITFGN